MKISRPDRNVDEVLLTHLDAAYRLARWQARNEPDAEAIVEEAYRRARRQFATRPGGTARARFLGIVSVVCREWRGRSLHPAGRPRHDEREGGPRAQPDPELTRDASLVERAIRSLPGPLREVLVLRDLEGLSYRELSDALNLPLGAVAVSLSQARRALSATPAARSIAASRHMPLRRVREG